MALTYRETKPCNRCGACYTHECEFARREVATVTRHVNDVAAIAGRKLPDVEVVFDCGTYWPGKERKEETKT